MSNITNSTELKEVITKLITPLDYGLTSLSNKVDHAAANSMFKEIEESLDFLYVKTRLLEDLNYFTEQYIQNKFKKISTRIGSAKQTVCKNAAEMLKTKQISHEVSFNFNTSMVTDRDGTSIDITDIAGNTMIPNNSVINTAEVSVINVSGNTKPYRQMKNDISQYRSFYCLEAPIQEVVENVQILFSKEITINMINLTSFKCSIDNLQLIRSDNQTINITPGTITTITPVLIKGMNIILKTNAYDITSFNILDMDDSSSYSTLNNSVITNLLDTMFSSLVSKKAG